MAAIHARAITIPILTIKILKDCCSILETTLFIIGAAHIAGYNADKLSVTKLNYVNNYLIPGVDSKANGVAYSESSPYNRAYFAGNYYQGKLAVDPWSQVDFPKSWTTEQIGAYKQSKSFETGPVKTEDAKTAYQRVLANAGAVLPKRDTADTRIVNNVKARNGSIIKSQEDVGGWPMLRSATALADTDKDGMPDDWETRNGLNSNDPSDRNKLIK